VWFAGVHGDIGGAYGPDGKTGACVSDTALSWMLDEARTAGLRLEPHLRAGLTDGVEAPVNRSRRHIYRFRRPLYRNLVVPGKPIKIHHSVKRRYLADASYRPPQLEPLLEKKGWDGLDLA
jgi:hypothetical protein